MPGLLLFLMLALSVSTVAQSVPDKHHGPDCSGAGDWAAGTTLAAMKNADLINPGKIDPPKTKIVRLASERIGKDLWHQVYLVSFTMKSGEIIQAIAVHDASNEECSMTSADVFVISKHLGSE